MQLNNLKDPNLSRKHKKCLGRGIGCSKGKTCGKGHKGQKARTGVSIKGFEGGQMPIERRLPKRGFNSHNKILYSLVSLDKLQKAIDFGKLDSSKIINIDALKLAGIIRKNSSRVKILSDGELKSSINIEVHAVSSSAKDKILSLGSTVNVI